MSNSVSTSSLPHYLVLDFGSQSLRALIINNLGQTVSKVIVDQFHYKRTEQGVVSQQPEWFFQQCINALSPLIADYTQQGFQTADIACMGITSMRNTLIALDDNHKPVVDAIVWQDRKYAECVPALNLFYRLAFTIADWFVPLKKDIAELQQQAAINKIRQRHQQQYRNIAHVCYLTGYLHYRFTGIDIDSRANLIGHLPFNFKHGKWQPKWHWYHQAFATKPQWLPSICDVGDVIANVKPEFSQSIGFKQTMPLVALASDKVSELIGSGCYRAGHLHISLGTAISVSMLTQRFKGPKPFYPAFPFVEPGLYVCELMLAIGMQLISDFIEQFGDCLPANLRQDELSCDVSRDELLARLDQQLMSLDETSAPATLFDIDAYCQHYRWQDGFSVVLDDFNGKDFDAEGSDDQAIGIAHYRALLDAIADNIVMTVSRLTTRLNRDVQQVYVSGGGSNSRYLCHQLKRRLAKPLFVSQSKQAGALGAAICLAYFQGHYPSLESAVTNMCQLPVEVDSATDDAVE
ncbi:FGGY family carbohydrate kinase [Thalassotalea sp. Y01]|uniref:FGGY family carbohydrate kinase n=1 Tax=Thalassotalea sp. Y01 TaxID=2729613 RepID=UPI00145EC2DA|nr:FGGY family carbohydrate kinase [Thalassotalea sp. Y01]NMP17487.1 hypothetical protein [Thalassotalea sp. Y01]